MIPPSYTPAALRAVLPVDEKAGRMGVAFDTESGPIRLAIPVGDAEKMAQWILGYIQPECQSDSSSGSPNAEGSPQEGQ